MRRASRGEIELGSPRMPHHRCKSGGRPRRTCRLGSSWTLRGIAEVTVSVAVIMSAALFVFGWFSETAALVSLVVLVLAMFLSARGLAKSGDAMGRRWLFRR